MMLSDALPREIFCFHLFFTTAAVARAREELSPIDRARLEAFARGKLSTPERGLLLPLLSSNSLALEYLAGLLKRGSSDEEEE